MSSDFSHRLAMVLVTHFFLKTVIVCVTIWNQHIFDSELYFVIKTLFCLATTCQFVSHISLCYSTRLIYVKLGHFLANLLLLSMIWLTVSTPLIRHTFVFGMIVDGITTYY